MTQPGQFNRRAWQPNPNAYRPRQAESRMDQLPTGLVPGVQQQSMPNYAAYPDYAPQTGYGAASGAPGMQQMPPGGLNPMGTQNAMFAFQRAQLPMPPAMPPFAPAVGWGGYFGA